MANYKQPASSSSNGTTIALIIILVIFLACCLSSCVLFTPLFVGAGMYLGAETAGAPNSSSSTQSRAAWRGGAGGSAWAGGGAS